MENWSKTLLYSYRYLQTIVDTIDEMVKKITIGSMGYNSRTTDNTMSQIERVINLNDRKLNLINLKVIIEECLNKLSQKDLEIISLYYIDGLGYQDVADTLNISIRTFFRRKSLAIERFAKYLNDRCNENYLYDNYSEEHWLMDFYYYNLKKSQLKLSTNCDIDQEYNNGKELFKTLKELRKMAI